MCVWGGALSVHTRSCVLVEKQMFVNIQARGKPRYHPSLFFKAFHKPRLNGSIVPRTFLSLPSKFGDYKPAPPCVAFLLGF